jgi:hypothetical protein
MEPANPIQAHTGLVVAVGAVEKELGIVGLTVTYCTAN